MGRDRPEEQTPSLFSTEHVGEPSTKQASDVTTARRLSRPLLPKDLPKALTYLDDGEFDRLFRATVAEADRRGKLSESLEASLTKRDTGTSEPMKVTAPTNRQSPKRVVGVAAMALTQGEVNAVRAAFKAGVTPSRIARQFGLSQSDVRRALASPHSIRSCTQYAISRRKLKYARLGESLK